jgi:hypothetical protein
MAKVFTDTLRDVSAKEQFGAIQSLTRSVLVTGLNNFNKDYRVINEVLQTLDAAGLRVDSNPPNMTTMELSEREVSVRKDSPTKADVLLKYVNRVKNAPLLTNTKSGVISISSSLQRVKSQVDRFNNQITTTHDGTTQGGEVSFDSPVATFTLQTVVQDDFPQLVLRHFLGTLNVFNWLGNPPETVLCTSIDSDPWDISTSPILAKYTFIFQVNPLGWQPGVVFKNADGRIPTGLVQGVGFYNVDMYPLSDFNLITT